ncbi:MAG: fumarate hydratase [Clostridia bacterium]|nr:fumarate hydratase [Clostridia bacterium]
MREIDCKDIAAAVRALCIEANSQYPQDLRMAVMRAEEKELSPVGRSVLSDLEANLNLARAKGLPLCQDTGLAVVFCDVGQEVHITGGLLADAVNEGVAKGYTEGLLRCSVVADPLRRDNTGNNAPAVLHLRLVEGDALDITVAPRGFGSENMTALKLFTPCTSQGEVEDYIVKTVDEAGADACPPYVVGVGLGGTSEQALLLSKRALLRPAGSENPDPFYADMESALLARINELGTGPQGLGGLTTAFSVSVLAWPTHMAGLPCAVSIGCHSTRRAGRRL